MKDFRTLLKQQIVVLDGAMGTMLQSRGLKPGACPEELNLTAPDTVSGIHREYVKSGADVIYTNTFGANSRKLPKGLALEDVIKCAVTLAKEQCENSALVAYSMGPIGGLLQPAGDISFDEAYKLFSEQAVLAEKYGANLIAVETVTDLYEMKAAVLAVRENCSLPVMCCMSFEENMRTFQGCTVSAMALTLEGLGADAIGINCSLGPAQILPIARELCRWTNLPVAVKANAGLPHMDGITYDVDSNQFADIFAEIIECGVSVIGGCCGTTPEYIKRLKQLYGGETPVKRAPFDLSAVCSPSKAVAIDGVRVIGERLNPTGKKLYKEALASGDTDYVLRQAIEQTESGADILDLNCGLPGIDETATMVKCMTAIQGIVDAPLQIDSGNVQTIERALRYYNGKPIVNSVNGETKSLEAILPLVKKYGAAVVGLTLDEGGIPATVQKRIEIAEKILRYAEKYGIKKRDVFIDPLTLTVSTEQEQVECTLEALNILKNRLGVNTVLGVSNISFGLPHRDAVNSTFLAMALSSGLTLPIINPNSAGMMEVVRAYRVLCGADRGAQQYIEAYSGTEQAQTAAHMAAKPVQSAAQTTATPVQSAMEQTAKSVQSALKKPRAAAETKAQSGDIYDDISYCVLKGLKGECAAAATKLLQSAAPMDVVNGHLLPALDKVGELFEKGALFLPQLIKAAEAAKGGFDEVKKVLQASGEVILKEKIILATVKGDIHDLGKNIVKIVLENYGYRIIDLGKNVDPEEIVSTALQQDVKLVGLSALMTTTVPSMAETIKQLNKAAPDIKVMVGGAVLTQEYADKIGADYYAKDANDSVKIAKKVFG